MTTDKVGALSAEQARLCCDEQERVSLQRVLRHHCETVASGDHVVVAQMTEAEARYRMAVEAPPMLCIVIDGHQLWQITEKEAGCYQRGYLDALRSLKALKAP